MTYVLHFNSRSQINAKNYFYSSLTASIAKNTLVIGLTIIAIILHLPTTVYNFIKTYFSTEPAILAVFVLFGYSFFLIVTLPFKYYSEYALDHRYGLSTQKLRKWFLDKTKSSTIMFGLVLLTIEAAYNFTRISLTWIFIAMAILIVFMVCLSVTSSSFIENHFYGGQKMQDKELLSRFSSLAAKSGLESVQVYQMTTNNTRKAIAESSGTSKGRKISLNDTLLKNYSNDEIESIVGHEIGHHKHSHIFKYALLFAIVVAIAFFGAFKITETAGTLLGLGSVDSIVALPLLALVFGLIYLASAPLMNTFSRWTERKCDEYELNLVKKPIAYISSIIKLTDQNLRYAYPNRIVEFLFYDHPSSEKRIKLVSKIKNQENFLLPYS